MLGGDTMSPQEASMNWKVRLSDGREIRFDKGFKAVEAQRMVGGELYYDPTKGQVESDREVARDLLDRYEAWKRASG